MRATHGKPPAEPDRGEEAACCLLRAHDAMHEHTDLDGEGFQLWFDFEEAALRCGVDPDLPREELVAAAEDLGCSCCRTGVATAPGLARPEAA